MSCQRTFNLKVNGATMRSPTNYWKLDNLSGGQALPSVGTNRLQYSVSATQVAGGLISANSVQLLQGSAGIPSVPCLYCVQGDFDFSSLVTGWTLRFWSKCLGGAFTTLANCMLQNRQGLSSGSVDWSIQGTGGNYGLVMFDNLFNDADALTSIAGLPVDSNWHRMAMIVDIVGKKVSFKVDNNATISTTAANPLFLSNSLSNFQFRKLGLDSDGTNYVCELGLWLEILLSETELTTDWNGGAGKTFP